MTLAHAGHPDAATDALAAFLERHRPLFVLTGAGCSTESGVPDYRDADGQWKHNRPVQYRDFIAGEHVRQRYWARSMAGWLRLSRARPNAAHRALAQLEALGYIHQLVTQNVDGLHDRAGSRRVIDLHGRIDTVRCQSCGRRTPRSQLQQTLEQLNGRFTGQLAASAPDGDAELEHADFSAFRVPVCERCGGLLKPDVVFFGESVPRARAERAYQGLQEASGVLVIGSSLMVYSGYRFCRAAKARAQPMAAINLGRTRADDDLQFKIRDSCGAVLERLVTRLSG
ncbi:MAG: NAD-dependent protein deacetylase [Gammaproteobacteria bacterium]